MTGGKTSRHFFLSEDGLLTTFVQQRKEDDENDKRPETADKSRI